MKRTTVFTAVFGLFALGFAAYGMLADQTAQASSAGHERLDKSQHGRLDKSLSGRLSAEAW